jgi:hypothetical protein
VLKSVAAQHLDADSTVRVALHIDDAGNVARYEFQWPRQNAALEADLQGLLATWSFPFLRRGGLCTLAVAVTSGVSADPFDPAEPQPVPKDLPQFETHPAEMVAPPIDPETIKPPVKIKPLPAKLVTQIEHKIYTKYRGKLLDLTAEHLPKKQQSQPVSVQLELDAAGKVVKTKIDMDEKQHVEYQRALAKLISKWQFKFVEQPGSCRVRVDPVGILLSKRSKLPPDVHMCERAPIPFEPKRD